MADSSPTTLDENCPGELGIDAHAPEGEVPRRKWYGNQKYPLAYGCKSRIYRIWRSMNQRCHLKGHSGYWKYGARGIAVCEQWREYMPFLTWALSNGYADTLTIDRIDTTRGYEPENCRWATIAQQSMNRTDTLPLFTAFGESKALKDWATDPRCRVSYNMLWRRVFEWNHPFEEALVTPPYKGRHRRS